MCQKLFLQRHMEDTVYDSSVTNTGNDGAETYLIPAFTHKQCVNDEGSHFTFTLTVFRLQSYGSVQKKIDFWVSTLRISWV